MLTRLYIKNFAIIEEQEIGFSSGLNIMTGETGAGKSIIVDALMLVLGERANTDMIRTGETKAIVEAVFELENNNIITPKILEEGFDCDNNEIIIRREILSKGSSRCFLNDSPVQLALLKELGDQLVDFHGQHRHQSLLEVKNHIKILDSAMSNKELFSEYKQQFVRLKEKINELKTLQTKKENLIRFKEEAEFKLEEIKKIDPKEGEDEKLEKEFSFIQNYELIFSLAGAVKDALDGDRDSVLQQLASIKKPLEELSAIDERFEEYYKEFGSTLIALKELNSFTTDYLSEIEYNPNRAEEIRRRLSKLNVLKKKYGSLDDILESKENLIKEIESLGNFDLIIADMLKDIEKLRKIAGKTAHEISKMRRSESSDLSKKIIELLAEMGIESAAFETNLELQPTEGKAKDTDLWLIMPNGDMVFADEKGADRVEFYMSANKGEDLKPLAETASGGEISRVMLAMKSVFSGDVPVMIFDEIDTGISGRIAQKVGFAMLGLSRKKQIISISHLPQIAALGDRNIHIEKNEISGRTISKTRVIENSDKTREIAKMISGDIISESALKNAEELIDFKHKYN